MEQGGIGMTNELLVGTVLCAFIGIGLGILLVYLIQLILQHLMSYGGGGPGKCSFCRKDAITEHPEYAGHLRFCAHCDAVFCAGFDMGRIYENRRLKGDRE